MRDTMSWSPTTNWRSRRGFSFSSSTSFQRMCFSMAPFPKSKVKSQKVKKAKVQEFSFDLRLLTVDFFGFRCATFRGPCFEQGRGWNPQRVHKAGKELPRRGGGHQLDNLGFAENVPERRVKLVVDLVRRAVQAVGRAKPQLLALAERAAFVVGKSVDLLRSRAFLLCQSRVGRDSIIAVDQQGHARRHQFLVPAG